MGAKNTLLRERNSAFRQRGARLGIQIAIQKMKISSVSKTCDMSDIAGIVYDDIKHPNNLLACERPFDVFWGPFLKYSGASILRQANPESLQVRVGPTGAGPALLIQ